MSKTDWEIREELRKKDPHFQKLWNVYATMDARFRKFDQKSSFVFQEGRRQKDICALMPKLKDEMYQIICRYRTDHPE